MTPPPFLLTDDELRAITGYVPQAKRVEALRKMRVPFRVNPRGQLLVARQAAEKWLGVDSGAPPVEEPDFEAFS